MNCTKLTASLLMFSAGIISAQTLTIPELFQQSYEQEYELEYEEALATMAEIGSMTDNYYMYHLRTAWLLYLNGEYTESVTEYAAAADAEPDAVEPYLGMLYPLSVQEKWLSIITASEVIIQKDPSNYTAASYRAWALYSLGRFDEAAAAYREILVLYPGDMDIRTGHGWSLLKAGNEADAEGEFNLVLSIAPQNRSALEGMAAITE